MPGRASRLLSIGFSCLIASGCGGQTPVPTASDAVPQEESPKPLTVDLGGGVKMEFVLLPKGDFMMGSPANEKGHNIALSYNPFFGPENLHQVGISKPFYLAKYSVTREQYEALMGDGWWSGSGGKRLPVEGIGWSQAQDFCKKMPDNDNQKRQFRLPTEAEWEYACRAGSTTAYYFGDDPKELGDYAWFADNSGQRIHTVGEKNPNAWGLFDMHGNVWQWCEDYWGPYEGLDVKDPLRSVDPFAEAEADAIAWRIAGHRVLRGGAWNAGDTYCRSACRAEDKQSIQGRGTPYGFRVAFCPD